MYCLCNGPERRPMVGCDACNGWFHYSCVGLTKKAALPDQWFCPRCRGANNEINQQLTSTIIDLKDALVSTLKEGFSQIKKIEPQATSVNERGLLQHEVERLSQENGHLTQVMQQQEMRHKIAIDSLHSKIKQLEGQHDEDTSTVSTFREEIEGLKDELQQQEIILTTLREEIGDLKEKLQEREIEVASLKKEKEDFEKKINLEKRKRKLSLSQKPNTSEKRC